MLCLDRQVDQNIVASTWLHLANFICKNNVENRLHCKMNKIVLLSDTILGGTISKNHISILLFHSLPSSFGMFGWSTMSWRIAAMSLELQRKEHQKTMKKHDSVRTEMWPAANFKGGRGAHWLFVGKLTEIKNYRNKSKELIRECRGQNIHTLPALPCHQRDDRWFYRIPDNIKQINSDKLKKEVASAMKKH
jgi:hypothetical protein